MVISDALAGHLHQVQVRARDEFNNESQWSEWSRLLLVRPWEGQKKKIVSKNTTQYSRRGRPAQYFMHPTVDKCVCQIMLLCLIFVCPTVEATTEPAEELPQDFFPSFTKPETSTAKSHSEFRENDVCGL